MLMKLNKSFFTRRFFAAVACLQCAVFSGGNTYFVFAGLCPLVTGVSYRATCRPESLECMACFVAPCSGMSGVHGAGMPARGLIHSTILALFCCRTSLAFTADHARAQAGKALKKGQQ